MTGPLIGKEEGNKYGMSLRNRGAQQVCGAFWGMAKNLNIVTKQLKGLVAGGEVQGRQYSTEKTSIDYSILLR